MYELMHLFTIVLGAKLPITFFVQPHYGRSAYLQMAEKETREITKQTMKISSSGGAGSSKQSSCVFWKNQRRPAGRNWYSEIK